MHAMTHTIQIALLRCVYRRVPVCLPCLVMTILINVCNNVMILHWSISMCLIVHVLDLVRLGISETTSLVFVCKSVLMWPMQIQIGATVSIIVVLSIHLMIPSICVRVCAQLHITEILLHTNVYNNVQHLQSDTTRQWWAMTIIVMSIVQPINIEICWHSHVWVCAHLRLPPTQIHQLITVWEYVRQFQLTYMRIFRLVNVCPDVLMECSHRI